MLVLLQSFKLDDGDYGNFTQDEINCINAMVNDTIDSERLDRVLNGQETHQLPGNIYVMTLSNHLLLSVTCNRVMTLI